MHMLVALCFLSILCVFVNGDCTSKDSPYKTNIYCNGFTAVNSTGRGRIQEVTAGQFPVIKGYLSMSLIELAPYCLRKIHWHAENEIAYVISGSAKVGVVGVGGKTSSFFTIGQGDAWYFPEGFVQYFQAGPEGISAVLWYNKDRIDTITTPQALLPIPPYVIQESFEIHNKSFFNEWHLNNDGIACPAVKPTWNLTVNSSNCVRTTPFAFHVACTNSTDQVRDQYGNLILPADRDSFPIINQGGLAFADTLTKASCTRVLHWHTIPGELALVVSGSAQIGLTVLEPADGSGAANYSQFNVSKGDVWFFPTGALQYVQSLAKPGGEDLVAILGFSYDLINPITSAQSLKNIPRDILQLSLDVSNSGLNLANFTTEGFSCLQLEKKNK